MRIRNIIVCDQAISARTMRRVPFNDAYKQWRNRARKFSRESIVNLAIHVLCEPCPDVETDLRKAPWLTLLMVKWVCQDRHLDRRLSPAISPAQFDDLRQRLWEFPERVDRPGRDTMPGRLFRRQAVRPQIGFQRDLSRSFVREGALLVEQGEDYSLRELFRAKTGLDVPEFIDLSVATFGATMRGERVVDDAWFSSLRKVYTAEVLSSFQSCVARTLPELVAFCRSLRDAKRKVASEYFEFPVLTRYPFLRREDAMICWHPTVLYRGLESLVHSVLSEEGQQYMDRFSGLFERHVVRQAKQVPAPFFDEDALRGWIAANTKVPDGLLSFPGCNVFVESKAGLFDESMMAVGNSEMFSHKTRAIRKAVEQAWATSVSLRGERRAPACVLGADVDYLLIVTNKELVVGRGTVLAEMYPKGTLDYPNSETERLLPLNRIYLLTIDDFERLTNGAADRQIDLPAFLSSCVADDSTPERALHLFEQHLERRRVPVRFSQVVEKAVEDSLARLKAALGG